MSYSLASHCRYEKLLRSRSYYTGMKFIPLFLLCRVEYIDVQFSLSVQLHVISFPCRILNASRRHSGSTSSEVTVLKKMSWSAMQTSFGT